MFSVLFEVRPKSDQWDAYLDYAKLLRPELEQVEGLSTTFVTAASLARDGYSRSRVGAMRSHWFVGERGQRIMACRRRAALRFSSTIISESAR
jgi:hypothetical protein